MGYFLIGMCLVLAITVIAKNKNKPMNWAFDGFLACIILWPLVVLVLIYYYFEED